MDIKGKLVYAALEWRLTNLTKIYENSHMAVYRACSEAWGEVIVKINNNADELCHEAEMLQALDGNGCCRLYAFEEAQGILVEEQITPGTVLRDEKDVYRRVERFVAVFETIHGSVSTLEFETYLDWLDAAKRYCEESVLSGFAEEQTTLKESGLLEKMQCAYEIGEELFAKYPEWVLLHGDLHHDNILKNSKGGYSVIDPKGVLGPEIFDVPRFVLNEFAYVKEESTEAIKKHLKQVMQLIGERLGYPVQDIRRLLFMETVLASVWSVEDGEEINETLIQVAEELGR